MPGLTSSFAKSSEQGTIKTAQQIIELCKSASRANLETDLRKGNIIEPPTQGRIVITGDLHGHRRNFQRIISFADLENNPQTHLVLQEILHGGPEDKRGGCLSFELLFEAVEYRLRFPDRVHIIMGNHDTAVITDTNVLRAGKEMNQALKDALKKQFPDDHLDLLTALRQYLLSQPLAVKCPNRIWLSHSLPADRSLNSFDTEIFNRELRNEDLIRNNSVYLLTWGRKHSPKTLEKLAQMLEVDTFIIGHQAQPEGWSAPQKNLLILASDHNHGCLLTLDLAKSYNTDELAQNIVPLASIE